jgi:hypothetical protein
MYNNPFSLIVLALNPKWLFFSGEETSANFLAIRSSLKIKFIPVVILKITPQNRLIKLRLFEALNK